MPEKFMQCGFLFKTYILHRFYSAMVKKGSALSVFILHYWDCRCNTLQA